MKTFNYIISTILRISLIFLFFFIWIRYYIKSLALVLILTSAFTMLFDGVLNYLIKKKDIKANLKKDDIARADGFCNHFTFNDKSVSLNFFYDMLNKKYLVIKKNEYIILKNKTNENNLDDIISDNNKKEFSVNIELTNQNSILFPYFKYNKLNVEDLIFICNKIRNEKYENVIICTNDIEEQARKIALSLSKKIILLNKYEVYENLMKKFDFYPTTSINFDEKTKMTFKEFLKISLNKRRATGYIFASLVLFISSFFVKVTIYYLIMSSILVLLSIFSFVNPIFNQKIQKIII